MGTTSGRVIYSLAAPGVLGQAAVHKLGEIAAALRPPPNKGAGGSEGLSWLRGVLVVVLRGLRTGNACPFSVASGFQSDGGAFSSFSRGDVARGVGREVAGLQQPAQKRMNCSRLARSILSGFNLNHLSMNSGYFGQAILGFSKFDELVPTKHSAPNHGHLRMRRFIFLVAIC